MDFKIYKNRLSQISTRLHLMVFLVFGLMLSNVALSGLLWKALNQQRIEITPFFSGSGYIKSPSMVDAQYLTLMTENFIHARLNVTPETVKGRHERLLHFVDAASWPQLVSQLQKEAVLIQKKKISSVFEISGLRTNPDNLTVHVEGVLKRYVGIKPVEEKRTIYSLAYLYQDGHISIKSFIQLKEKSHA